MKQAYYLEPDEIGRKAFYLLKSVLAETSKTAICKIVLKDREQLAAPEPVRQDDAPARPCTGPMRSARSRS